ncbi:hypothetical protein [Methanosarcina mazei]|uniref:hypothetical protein n=1 Tax=Methanosarcina mazei TaxID=2209 RepID=UPI00064E19A2|nr:hypothetical protein [Methanosarcina mazei]
MKNEEARVHFIPTLKDGVFVTLCAPLVIRNKDYRNYSPDTLYPSIKNPDIETGNLKTGFLLFHFLNASA